MAMIKLTSQLAPVLPSCLDLDSQCVHQIQIQNGSIDSTFCVAMASLASSCSWTKTRIRLYELQPDS